MNSTNLPIDYSLNSEPIISSGILTDDLLETIFKQLDKESLLKVALISREWYVKSSSDAIWRLHVNPKVKTPHLKYQLKCQLGLNKIYSDIHMKYLLKTKVGLEWIYSANQTYVPINLTDKKQKSNEPACNFFCKLIKSLFKGNILSITNKYLNRFEIVLIKERKINFKYGSINNIEIPKKVCFYVNTTNVINGYEPYLDFIENPIKMNVSLNYTFLCKKIEWDDHLSFFQFICTENSSSVETKIDISPETFFDPYSVQ
jgi:hypothetical protein